MEIAKNINSESAVAMSPPVSPSMEKTKGVGEPIVLVPRPSEDPRDPLNWSFSKKARIVAVMCVAVFSAYAAPLAGQVNLVQQAKLYHHSVTEVAYANSVASAGLASGGFFLAPLAHKFGRSSVIFWTLIGCLAAQIWAPYMTRHDDYSPYVVSRFFSGFFGGLTGVLGSRLLYDMFFLHQRGRAFTAFYFSLNFGTVAGPTFSGLVAANAYWPVEYWWNVSMVALSAVLVFLFLEETGFNREDLEANPPIPQSLIRSRVSTFFFGQKVVPKTNISVLRSAAVPFLIAISPVTLLLAFFTLISFGFYIALNLISPIFLQKPVKVGGYDFTVEQNAYFTFAHWIGLIIALIWGHTMSDRLPLALAKRNHGVWKPEYRLHALWIPSFILAPIGLGLFGAGLQYHLSWGTLAGGSLLVTIGDLAMLPVTVNYVCECFKQYPAEASIVVNLYRLAFGLSITFFIDQWMEDVSAGWVYGTMAFMSLGSFVAIILLMWKGSVIRGWTPAHLSQSEEGDHVIKRAGSNA